MANPNDLILALDTGTRTVTGVVLDDRGPVPRVLAAVTREHRSRSMLDGQIHDIEAVAEVVRQVKEELEQRLGLEFTEAAVAAAGRALLTRRGAAALEIAQLGEVEPADVRQWELEAVEQAQAQLRAEAPRDDEVYHCVGYAVVGYELDGSRIKSLVGHRGRQAAVEVLATFLPEVVVDSLYTVLRRAGLAVASMTLEPIAASQVVIPVDLRQLNLALVDVGAGTSDIAVARHGSLIGFGMVPFAGDEVSERLAETYLLDFATAEQVKRGLAAAADLDFADVLGNRHRCPAGEVVAVLEPVVSELAERIAAQIVALNERPPSAVLLVGGGSLTPLLPAKLAERLSLPPNRVVVRGREELPVELEGELEGLAGPEAVTPIGIALSSRSQKGMAFRSWEVTVNERRVRLFNLVSPRVADALLAAGIPAGSLRGRLGLALTVKVNGEFRVVPGTPGQPGRLLVNEAEAGLDTPLADGDRLTVVPAVDGQDATATLADLLPQVSETPVSFNRRRIVLRPLLMLNGRPAQYTDAVPDGAELEFRPRNRLGDLLDLLEVTPESGPAASFVYYLNGDRRARPWGRPAVLVNGEEASLERELRPGDAVEVGEGGKALPTVAELLRAEGEGAWSPGRDLHVTVNGTPVTLPGRPGVVRLNGREASLEDPVPEGADLRVEPGADAQAYFAEVFNHYPLDLANAPVGQRLVLRLNGAEAEYTSPLSEGDAIEVRWE